MSIITVTTQQELDQALADHGDDWKTTIVIDSPRGVWLQISASGSATVEASGSATVRASGSATVRAFDSATVEASGSATVRAFDSATVEAFGSATVRAFDSATVRASGSATVEASGSATVEASGSATVRASGSATVEAFGSATVRAFDSATVEASDSATVRASDSATVEAFGSATVRAFDSATVRAGSHVAVHLHSAAVTLSGGVVIDVTEVASSTDPLVWADYHGAEVDDQGRILLHKAVDGDLTAGHGWTPTRYPLSETVEAPDWSDDHECGGGLHASPHPHQALRYAPEATRMLVIAVDPGDLRPILSTVAKAKARRVRVLREVALDGGELA